MPDAGPTADLALGLAAALQDAGVGTFDPDGQATVPDGGVELVLKMLPAAPDRALVLDVIPTQDDALNAMGQYSIRLRGRGAPNDPLDVDSILDAAFAVLHGMTYRVFGSVTLTQLLRRPNGVTQQGFDASKRWHRSDQYVADVDYPATAQRP